MGKKHFHKRSNKKSNKKTGHFQKPKYFADKNKAKGQFFDKTKYVNLMGLVSFFLSREAFILLLLDGKGKIFEMNL